MSSELRIHFRGLGGGGDVLIYFLESLNSSTPFPPIPPLPHTHTLQDTPKGVGHLENHLL